MLLARLRDQQSILAFYIKTNLVSTLVQPTTKSRRQFTPKLIQNPKLTKKGIVGPTKRSYDYNLPDDLPNRHLYWDRKIMNKKLKQRYNSYKLLKLGLNPIHENKQRTFNRQLPQILNQLSRLQIIKNSIGRTFENIHQCLSRFPKQSLAEQKGILLYAFSQIHKRFIHSLSFYEFSRLCYLGKLLQVQPSQSMMITFYKFLLAAEEQQNNKINFNVLCGLVQYIFSRKYDAKNDEIMFKKPVDAFKLFEANDPKSRTFEQILPNIYTAEGLEEIRKMQGYQKKLKILSKIPGGQILAQRINK